MLTLTKEIISYAEEQHGKLVLAIAIFFPSTDGFRWWL